ncbi:glycoside hydrolase family 2 TIM barrel-domain containing protein [Actinomycetaceae bacterium MB13-C1-2]|nr:glycoside hydrolase family 2 TIM barrel-domain containing protein [Actinomycetaceae bacterium MB13-C1-2]
MFDPAVLSDPEFVSEGRLPAHSDHRWFADTKESQRDVSSYEQSLDGLWKFQYAKNPNSAPAGFESLEFDTSEWDDIRVPAHIQMEGYDRPQYANTQYPWDGNEEIAPPNAPMKFNPTACYVKDFVLERELEEGERVTVTFNGAESALVVWLNGHYVGYAEDTFTPSEFDLTPYLVDGENKLAAEVVKWCSGSWLEDQDFYRFSGLFRSVVLRTYPKVHARDVKVGVDLPSDLKNAVVRVEVELQGEGSATVSLDGVGEFSQDGQGLFTAHIPDPRLWSSEDPYLYEGWVKVLDTAGVATEYIPIRVGVRRFGIEDGLLKINGERIVFFGVNRHDFGLDGRVMTREQTEADLIALKRAGLNAIRTSHYPNNSFLYELADEYGFYVIDEMNLESHGLWDLIRYADFPDEAAVPGNDPVWLPLLLDRAASMYQRDKNHPSIVIWSCGNESYGGTDILEVSNYFRSVDSRPVHYEGITWDPRYPDTTDVYSQMYTPAAKIEEFLEENLDKPFILCEYAHAMGNSLGSVDRYIELAYREPRFQGGFIWDFADQAILMKDRYGNEYFGYGGDNGEAPHDSDFSGNGIFFADHTPKPFMQEVKYLYQGIRGEVEDKGFSVTNRYNFTNTSAFECVVTLCEEDEVLEAGIVNTDVAPGETKKYPFPFEVPTEAGEYVVDVSFQLREPTSYAEAAYEVASEQGVIKVDTAASAIARREPQVVQGIHNIGVHGPNFSALFSRLQGGLSSYKYGVTSDRGGELLKAVPTANFWHAPTSNERGWKSSFEDGQWLLASRYAKVDQSADSPRFEMRDGLAVVTYTYDLPTIPPSQCEIEYAVDGEGRIEVTETLRADESLPELPEFGMIFKTDADLSVLTWYGDGPQETYSDRQGGGRLGVYQQSVDDQLAEYLRPQESGNHTEVRWAEVTDEKGHGLRFEAEVPMEFSALPWSPFEIENASHHNELPPILNTFIRPALVRRGVAGDDSWGARPHEEFRIPAGELQFKFAFQGIK